MKTLFTISAAFSLLSCAPSAGYITEAQLQDSAFVAGTFDTLSAYRKAPGGTKAVAVEGYYRKDSTYIAPHTRTARRTKKQMVTQ